jgi:cyanophycinase
MLELVTRIAQSPMVILNQYPVMVIGGAEDKVNDCDILKAFFGSAGGDQATIGILPCASREPNIIGDRYLQIFQAMGATHFHLLDIRQPDQANEAQWLDLLRSCTGLFITGGDQLRLCSLIGGTKLMDLLKQRVKEGHLIVAGTSAGAAIMGEQMIAGGSSGESPNRALVDLTEGLSILPELLVDQHFHNRNRMARLLSAVAAHPDKLGIGIDEDTCAAFVGDGTFQVLGNGAVTVVDPGQLTRRNYLEADETSPLRLHNLKVHILCQGDRYDYKRRIVL